MSAPAVGVGDIVAAGKFAYKAVEALRENHDGARHHFRQIRTGLSHRTCALEDIIDECDDSASTQDLQDAVRPALDEDRSLQLQLSPLEKDLGRGAKKGPFRGTISKLKYALDGDKKVREHLERARPATDAVVMRAIQATMKGMNEHASSQSREFGEFEARLNTRLDSFDVKLGATASEQQLQLRHTEIHHMLKVLTAALPACQGSSTENPTPTMLRSPIRASPAATAIRQRPQRDQQDIVRPRTRHHAGQTFETAPSLRPAGVTTAIEDLNNSRMISSSSFTILSDTPQRASRDQNPHRQADPNLGDASRLVSDWLHLIFALSASVAYQSPLMRNAVLSQLRAAQTDPAQAVLMGCVLMALARVLNHVPRLICGLSDDSIDLQTLLGEEITIPSIYWKSNDIFHGYLMNHFRSSVVQDWVARRSYLVLIGGSEGIVIDQSKWSVVVAKRMKLTMAATFDQTGFCPRCQAQFDSNRDEPAARHCSSCKETFRVFEEETQQFDGNMEGELAVQLYNTTKVRAAFSRLKASDVWNKRPEEIAPLVNIILSVSAEHRHAIRAAAAAAQQAELREQSKALELIQRQMQTLQNTVSEVYKVYTNNAIDFESLKLDTGASRTRILEMQVTQMLEMHNSKRCSNK